MYAWNASSTAKLWPVGIEYAKRSDVDIGGSQAFWAAKRVFDITLGLLILPALALVALSLLLANPFFNRGPLFYSQIRMGRGGKPFREIRRGDQSGVVSVGHDVSSNGRLRRLAGGLAPLANGRTIVIV